MGVASAAPTWERWRRHEASLPYVRSQMASDTIAAGAVGKQVRALRCAIPFHHSAPPTHLPTVHRLIAIVTENVAALDESLRGLIHALVRPFGECYQTVVSDGVLAEVEAGEPRVVLAFGPRAAAIFCPTFSSMSADHGKPGLGPNGRYVSMALWQPFANPEVMGMIATDLLKVDALLTDGLVELIQPAPPPTWPTAIGFLLHGGVKKSYKCRACGALPAAIYAGEGLSWKLCMRHAIAWGEWALTHMDALREHRADAVAASAAARAERTAVRMQAELQDANERLYSKREPVVGAKGATEPTVCAPAAQSGESPAPGGSELESTCVAGASEQSMEGDAIDSDETSR